MADKKYLDLTGLTAFKAKLLGKIDGLLANKADKSHVHDDRYYTEAEVDSKLSGKAPSSHTHTIAQVTNLQSSLDGKSDKTHNHDSVYAKTSHNHSADNITSGVLPIGRGGTGAATAKTAQNNLFEAMDDTEFTTVTDTTYSVIAAPYQHATNKDKGRLRVVTASKLWNYIKSKTDGLYALKSHNHDAAYAAKTHNHDAGNITSGILPVSRGGTGAASANGIRGAIGFNPVTTGGTGAAYTATVNGITSLVAGASFIMVPNVVSTSTSPTLNVNNLGAKQIRQRLSGSSATTTGGASNGWLAAGKPVEVTYDGAFWVVDFTRPDLNNGYGTLSIEKGGTGANTRGDAVRNILGSYNTNGFYFCSNDGHGGSYSVLDIDESRKRIGLDQGKIYTYALGATIDNTHSSFDSCSSTVGSSKYLCEARHGVMGWGYVEIDFRVDPYNMIGLGEKMCDVTVPGDGYITHGITLLDLSGHAVTAENLTVASSGKVVFDLINQSGLRPQQTGTISFKYRIY